MSSSTALSTATAMRGGPANPLVPSTGLPEHNPAYLALTSNRGHLPSAAMDLLDSAATEMHPEPTPRTEDAPKDDAASKKANPRKRTKTGCKTCRERRIKCDEGKPTCNNCFKSKRKCLGYAQRVVFKEPTGVSHHAPLPFGHALYEHPSHDMYMGRHLDLEQSRESSSQGPLPMIAPRPPSMEYPPPGHALHYGSLYQVSLAPPHGPPQLGLYTGYQEYPDSPFVSPTDVNLDPLAHGSYHNPAFMHDSLPGPLQADFDGIEYMPPPPNHRFSSDSIPSMSYSQHFPSDLETPPLDEPSLSGISCVEESPLAGFQSQRETAQVKVESEEDSYWHSDDEASMMDSDDDDTTPISSVHQDSTDLGTLVAQRMDEALKPPGLTRLGLHDGLDANFNCLDTYTPSSASSPLNDGPTASVFWYFIHVTGHCISLYERHSFDPSPMFQGQAVLKAQQRMWIYTFPVMAFHHPALLQAMLALSSLQMAKLQEVPPTAAMKHYHLSLRRLAKNYQSLTKRSHAATLGATLLLGYYEVWNSDHDKWCRHMWGARQILREISLADMTRDILALKHMRRQRQQYGFLDGQTWAHDIYSDDAASLLNMDDTDPDFIAQIVGHGPLYANMDRPREGARLPKPGEYTTKDIENYDNLRDLYWWYCKMDVYQSFLGGTRLFMEYNVWTQCAPRAPFGRPDAVCGTFDHLVLLLGRLATFMSRDVVRKRKARKAEAEAQGQDFGMGSSPASFPGLMPPRRQFLRPEGFSPTTDAGSAGDTGQDQHHDTLASADAEWKGIARAFDMFRGNLGPDFQPQLQDCEGRGPQATPFGPSTHFRNHVIAGMWMNYYMGLILLHRCHPSMPPVATSAAGMAAKTTAEWAAEIGRIAAGLREDTGTLTPGEMKDCLGSAFIESCLCLFVAGVQYQDQAQRYWLVQRLHDIARLTGWQSARQISQGCESAWIKAASQGRGPPYDPTFSKAASQPPPSIEATPRRLDRRMRELPHCEHRLVLATTERAHYALGILEVEHDLEKLDLGDV